MGREAFILKDLMAIKKCLKTRSLPISCSLK